MKRTPWRIWAFLGLTIVFATLSVQQLRGVSFREAANNIVDLSFAQVNGTDQPHLSAGDKKGQLGVISASTVSNESMQSENRTSTMPAKIESPQVLKLGRFKTESAYPYLSVDVWYEIVDNNETFFLRPQHFTGNLSLEQYWLNWLDNVSWPVKLVMNNNVDWSYPHPKIPITPSTLDHKNLERLYVMNPVILHPKIMPLPIGLKWQWRSTDLYGERKGQVLKFLKNVSLSSEMTRSLFESPNRTETVWLRPSTRRRQFKYERTNAALKTPRDQICGILQGSAPNSTVCAQNKISFDDYFDQLRIHRFVVSSAGVGLDTHATWEALLAGCIPIVPKSPLSPMYEFLPVWQVDSWEEVTDEAVAAKSREFLEKGDALQWDMAFATGWEKLLKKH